MNCPHCESSRISRDYAPPRTYALILTGLALVFVTRFFEPAIFRVGQEQLQRWLMVGGLVMAYGVYDAFRHGNRFCETCGFRFRQKGRAKVAGPLPSQLWESSTATASTHKAVAPCRREDTGSVNPHTPIEPLLACLRFRDAEKRETAAATLRKLTGESFGADADAWNAWWQENKESYKASLKDKKG